MLKFFRKYNKFILAFGAAFLMIAFLIEPTLSIFMRGPEDQPVGRVEGQRLTEGDRQSAAVELDVLERVHPVVGMLARDLAENDPLKWLLMKHDARRLGLTASDAEVQNLLETFGLYEDELRQASARMGTSTGFVQQSLRSWLTLEQYRDLILGRTHVNPLERLQAMAFAMQAQELGDWQLMMQVEQMLADAFGHHRLSEPLIRHMLRDLQTTVSGEVAIVDARRYLDETDEPTDEEMQSLFEQYRDVPPGQGEPYGFGYRIPPRVKLEYLAIPIDRVREQVEIDEVDMLSYYEENEDEFRNDAEDIEAGEPEIQPYEQVRSRIQQTLRDQQADQLANRIVRAAQAMLVQHARQLQQHAGYRVVPDDYQPPSLREMADQIEQQFNVRPERYDDFADEWVPVHELEALPGIGRATLAGRDDISFRRYVHSAWELEPADDDPLVGMGLQAMLPSQPLERGDGSRFLFRLTEAQPSHAPESLETVADRVRQDAHLRKAYEQHLLPAMEQWLSDAREQGLESLAEAEGLMLETIRPTPRRAPDRQGRLSVPDVPGVGRSEALISGMFDIAERVSEGGRMAVSEADEADRLGVAEVDSRLSMVIYRVDRYQPVTEGQYREMVASPRVKSWVSQMMLSGDGDAMASLSNEAVRARVNFVPSEREARDDDAPAREPQRRPGQI
ncbi:hypothetical protein ACERK3_05445 [Phycisphaerales bacterium AB-hyl4]|uniref:Peptidyl-prolyl cis-trans isomerase D n=1 Tax=Natronomicrosphaera hydrolytica TaxID=3242702 RepID=A0ABV4U2C2_9BACT